MPCFINPSVLVTRPKDSSERFVRDLRAVAGPFEPVICPAFEYERLDAPLPDFDVAIFTSRAGVMFAPKGRGRTAYCVGDATANAATQSGYEAVSAQGTVDDLLSLILGDGPVGRLLHVRGETSVGDVMHALASEGLDAGEVIAYRKATSLVGLQRAVQVSSGSNLIFPVFSAETVSILAASGLNFSALNTVAISEGVAAVVSTLSPASLSIAAAPNQAKMIAAVARMIA